MSTVAGVLLRAGVQVEPEQVFVSDLESIQGMVGGTIDAVRAEYNDVVIVGYCHDEGLLLDLPMNWMASALFTRELRGDVVLVSGTSPDGNYDGENYDVPPPFVRWLSTTFIARVAESYNMSNIITDALSSAVDRGFVTMTEIEEVMQFMVGAANRDESDEAMKKLSKLGETILERGLAHEESGLIDEIDEFLKGETK